MWKIAKGFLIVWMFWVAWGAICWTPPAKTLGETGRVIYFHVPMAWIAVLSFIVSLVFSVRTLMTSSPLDDIKAEVASRLGLWFSLIATVTGSVFAKHAWNAWWNWDPRETSIVVLILIYLAYFGLRMAMPDPDKRMRSAAVYAILACAVMPFLVFVVPRIYMSLHPDTFINKQGKMLMTDPRMKLVFFSSMLGFTGVFAWMYNLSVKIERMIRGKEGWDV